MLDQAGEGEGERMGPCSVTRDSVSCQPSLGSCSAGSKSISSPKHLRMETHCPQNEKGTELLWAVTINIDQQKKS